MLQLSRNAKLIAPAINVHDAVTRTMINNYYCQKESIIDVLKVVAMLHHSIIKVTGEFCVASKPLSLVSF